jgi:glycerol-3-phosphate dehydrogenase subunit C
MRHVIAWHDADFYDPAKLDTEMRRVFDICHGCCRCFNLCDSFPRLFDLIDQSPSEELADVDSKQFKSVVDACTLCDMCFLTKCPYVPPHQFDLDVPHLFLRYRAVQLKQGEVSGIDRQLTETDRNGKLGCGMAGVANWATDRGNTSTRWVLEKVAGIDRQADLPRYAPKSFSASAERPPVASDAPAYGRKVVIYATCFANYNSPEIGNALRGVLARNGVETEVVYPECCGMPQLEYGDLARVAEKARTVAHAMADWIDKGWDIVALVPSCALMMKFEWPLIVADDDAVKKLSKATYDVAEYIVDISKKEGLAPGLGPLDGQVALHMACHARAQNMGQKAAEMLDLIPDAKVKIIERCSGHGGSWGIKKGNFETALKVGKPVARQAAESGATFLVSECPLARDHIVQGAEALGADKTQFRSFQHPIQVLAHAYGL